MTVTMFDQLRLEGQLKIVLKLLEAKYGPLQESTRKKLSSLSEQELEEIAIKMLRAKNLQELGQEGD